MVNIAHHSSSRNVKQTGESLDVWRQAGRRLRARCIRQDSVALEISPQCPIDEYVQVSNQILNQFLEHPVDLPADLLKAYILGQRLQQFLTKILPQHPQFKGKAERITVDQSRTVEHYVEQMALMIDQIEYKKQQLRLYKSSDSEDSGIVMEMSGSLGELNDSDSISGKWQGSQTKKMGRLAKPRNREETNRSIREQAISFILDDSTDLSTIAWVEDGDIFSMAPGVIADITFDEESECSDRKQRMKTAIHHPQEKSSSAIPRGKLTVRTLPKLHKQKSALEVINPPLSRGSVKSKSQFLERTSSVDEDSNKTMPTEAGRRGWDSQEMPSGVQMFLSNSAENVRRAPSPSPKSRSGSSDYKMNGSQSFQSAKLLTPVNSMSIDDSPPHGTNGVGGISGNHLSPGMYLLKDGNLQCSRKGRQEQPHHPNLSQGSDAKPPSSSVHSEKETVDSPVKQSSDSFNRDWPFGILGEASLDVHSLSSEGDVVHAPSHVQAKRTVESSKGEHSWKSDELPGPPTTQRKPFAELNSSLRQMSQNQEAALEYSAVRSPQSGSFQRSPFNGSMTGGLPPRSLTSKDRGTTIPHNERRNVKKDLADLYNNKSLLDSTISTRADESSFGNASDIGEGFSPKPVTRHTPLNSGKERGPRNGNGPPLSSISIVQVNANSSIVGSIAADGRTDVRHNTLCESPEIEVVHRSQASACSVTLKKKSRHASRSRPPGRSMALDSTLTPSQKRGLSVLPADETNDDHGDGHMDSLDLLALWTTRDVSSHEVEHVVPSQEDEPLSMIIAKRLTSESPSAGQQSASQHDSGCNNVSSLSSPSVFVKDSSRYGDESADNLHLWHERDPSGYVDANDSSEDIVAWRGKARYRLAVKDEREENLLMPWHGHAQDRSRDADPDESDDNLLAWHKKNRSEYTDPDESADDLKVWNGGGGRFQSFRQCVRCLFD